MRPALLVQGCYTCKTDPAHPLCKSREPRHMGPQLRRAKAAVVTGACVVTDTPKRCCCAAACSTALPPRCLPSGVQVGAASATAINKAVRGSALLALHSACGVGLEVAKCCFPRYNFFTAPEDPRESGPRGKPPPVHMRPTTQPVNTRPCRPVQPLALAQPCTGNSLSPAPTDCCQPMQLLRGTRDGTYALAGMLYCSRAALSAAPFPARTHVARTAALLACSGAFAIYPEPAAAHPPYMYGALPSAGASSRIA